MKYYMLNNKEITSTDDVNVWSKWGQDAMKTIAVDIFDDITVSTVFLGVDIHGNDQPLLFETTVFGGPNDGYQKRYATQGQALLGHNEAVKAARYAH